MSSHNNPEPCGMQSAPAGMLQAYQRERTGRFAPVLLCKLRTINPGSATEGRTRGNDVRGHRRPRFLDERQRSRTVAPLALTARRRPGRVWVAGNEDSGPMAFGVARVLHRLRPGRVR